MAREEVDAALRAYGGDPAKLSRTLRRRYELERKVLLERAARGEKLNPEGDWVIAEIRSGEWERRTSQNMRALLRDRAKLAQWKRDGYWFDEERRLQPPPAIVPVAAHRESLSRPRERRSAGRRRTASRAGPSSSDPDEPPPPEHVRGFASRVPAATKASRAAHGKEGGVSKAAVDHFAPIPLRFIHAHEADELDAKHVLIGTLLAARCYQVRNTAGGIAASRLSALAELGECSEETVRTKLHELRERGWIDLEAPRPGQRAAWRIWLTGLALRDESSDRAAPELQTSSRGEHRSVGSSSSRGAHSPKPANPHEQRQRTSRRTPDAPLKRLDKRNETRPDERREDLRSKEKLDHVVGEAPSRAALDFDESLRPDLVEENPFPPQGGYEVGGDARAGGAALQPRFSTSRWARHRSLSSIAVTRGASCEATRCRRRPDAGRARPAHERASPRRRVRGRSGGDTAAARAARNGDDDAGGAARRCGNGDVSERLLTARELAEYLGLSSATVLDWFEGGRLPGFRLGGKKGGQAGTRTASSGHEAASRRGLARSTTRTGRPRRRSRAQTRSASAIRYLIRRRSPPSASWSKLSSPATASTRRPCASCARS